MKRLMIIDDEPGFTQMLAMNLKLSERFEIEVVNDARKALRKTVAFQPDIVLLDVIMPHLDGGDILTLLRSEPTLEGLPIILLTALVSKDQTVAGMGVAEEVGLVMLSKTTKFDTLLKVIDSNLEEK